MKANRFIVPLVLSAVLTACAPTQTSRSAGQTLDDTTLTAKVKTELAKTQGVGDALAVNVDTYRGVVSLSGFVDSQQQMQTAVQAASRVPGVTKVDNNMRLKSRP
jgi:hyperosmotically inducible protein